MQLDATSTCIYITYPIFELIYFYFTRVFYYICQNGIFLLISPRGLGSVSLRSIIYTIESVHLLFAIKHNCDIWPSISIVDVWLPIGWCGIDGFYK